MKKTVSILQTLGYSNTIWGKGRKSFAAINVNTKKHIENNEKQMEKTKMYKIVSCVESGTPNSFSEWSQRIRMQANEGDPWIHEANQLSQKE